MSLLWLLLLPLVICCCGRSSAGRWRGSIGRIVKRRNWSARCAKSERGRWMTTKAEGQNVGSNSLLGRLRLHADNKTKAAMQRDCEMAADELNLTGDGNVPAMPMTDAQVNHLRRLLAWMRCEWMIDDDMQRGYVKGASACVQIGTANPEEAGTLLMDKAEQMRQCPAYVRQAVKMLTKALRAHDRAAGIVEPNAHHEPLSGPKEDRDETR